MKRMRNIQQLALAGVACGLVLMTALSCRSGETTAGLAAAPNTLTAAEKAAGWTLLFDGTSFDGWRGLGRNAVPEGHCFLSTSGAFQTRAGTFSRGRSSGYSSRNPENWPNACGVKSNRQARAPTTRCNPPTVRVLVCVIIH